jgi:predicted alpha/beta-hydrolase family hydrolase
VQLEDGTVTALEYRAQAGSAFARLILAHGAGANQRSSFMTGFARALADLGLSVVTFNFPYTERGRRLPDRRPVLDACYRAVVTSVARTPGPPVFAGGKSMGGRIATHIAADDPGLPLAGVVLLGYPLHPPGRISERRDAHLPSVGRPMLFVQGSRDPFGTPEELAPVLRALIPAADLHVVEGGDHSFKVRGGPPAAQVEQEIQEAITAWIRRVIAPASPGTAPPRR